MNQTVKTPVDAEPETDRPKSFSPSWRSDSSNYPRSWGEAQGTLV